MSESLENAPRYRKLLSFFGRKPREGDVRSSIAALIKESASPGGNSNLEPELDRQERVLISNVLHLREKTADDVMIPRADIVSLPDDVRLDQALAFMRRENHSRVPVYHEQLDHVVGMLHVKDLIAYVGTSDAFSLEPLLRQPLFVAPQIPVLDLMLQMRQRRTHLALVIDEYGGIDGLVTIEDLIETIVGDIADEHDDPVSEMLIERPDKTLDIDSRMPVEQFESRVGRVLTDGEREAEIETVGGLVFHLAGHVPTRGEVFVHESGLIFRVTESDARHIRALRVRIPEDWIRKDVPSFLDEQHEK